MYSIAELVGCHNMSTLLLGKPYDIRNNTKFFQWKEPLECGLPFARWKEQGLNNDQLIKAIEQSGWKWIKFRDEFILVDRMTDIPWDDICTWVSTFRICEEMEMTASQIKLAIIRSGVHVHKMDVKTDKWYLNLQQKRELTKFITQ